MEENKWFNKSIEEAEKILETNIQNGLTENDVKTKRDKWRLIIEPLDDNEEKFIPCNIDLIAKIVKIIEIKEVSNHYE